MEVRQQSNLVRCKEAVRLVSYNVLLRRFGYINKLLVRPLLLEKLIKKLPVLMNLRDN